MTKYRCNSCGEVHDVLNDALRCHPNVTRVDDGTTPDRAVEQRDEADDAGQTCPSCGGSGEIGMDLPAERCSQCAGTGHGAPFGVARRAHRPRACPPH